ncbi:MAG: S-layer protein [Methanomicrobia archaeon]|nr:S-layer protein [Methanomicrobia archaeon]
MIRKSCLVFFLLFILVITFLGAEKRANAFVYRGESIFVEGKEIELVDYRITNEKYEVTLRIDDNDYVLKEGESLEIEFEITFLEREIDRLSFAFYISALPCFDELKEVILYEGQTAQVKKHEIIIESVDTQKDRVIIFFDGEEFFISKYDKLESGDLHIWLFKTVIGLSNPYAVLKCRFFYRDVEDTLFPEHVLRIPSTKEANCIVIVGRETADHEIADKIAESLNCEVLYDDQIEESHKMSYNFILVGGPCPPCGKTDPANKITYELVEKGLSQKEYWITGNGSQEGFTYFKDPWGHGKDVLVVAGSDREFTYATGENFIELL